MRRLRKSLASVWLGVFALLIAAALPVYLIPDIISAVGAEAAPCPEHVAPEHAAHVHADARGHTHKGHADCALCGAIGTLAAASWAIPPVPPVLPEHFTTVVPERLVVVARAVPAHAYSSRAPPQTA